MTIKTENWLGEYTSTIGTGDITLGGAIDGFAGFSNVGENVDVYYTVMDALDKETGIGTLTGGKLVRKDIHAILVDGAYVKNGSAINLSGNAQVYGTANAHFLDYVQAVANAEIVNTQAIAELKALQINGHALTASFNLTAADVGAHPDSWMPSTEALNVYQKAASDIRYLKTQDAEQVAGLVMRVGGAREQQLQQSINDVSTAFIGDAPPAGAPVGKRWFDTESGRTYIKYNDGDSTQWIEESPQGLSPDGLESRIDEALRRSYAEAGYNLVGGSFEVGGALVNANDVLLHKASGKAFTGPTGPVAEGTDPTSGGFVDRSTALLREELLSDNGFDLVKFKRKTVSSAIRYALYEKANETNSAFEWNVRPSLSDATSEINAAILDIYKLKQNILSDDEIYSVTLRFDQGVDYKILGTVIIPSGVILDFCGSRVIGPEAAAGGAVYDTTGSKMFITGRYEGGAIVSNLDASSEVVKRVIGSGVRGATIINSNCPFDLVNFQEMCFLDDLRFSNCSLMMRTKGSFYARYGNSIRPLICRTTAQATGQPAVLIHGAAAHQLKFDCRIVNASIGYEVTATNSFDVEISGSLEEGRDSGSIGVRNNGAYCQSWSIKAYFEGVDVGITGINNGTFNGCLFAPQYFSSCNYSFKAQASTFRRCRVMCPSIPDEGGGGRNLADFSAPNNDVIFDVGSKGSSTSTGTKDYPTNILLGAGCLAEGVAYHLDDSSPLPLTNALAYAQPAKANHAYLNTFAFEGSQIVTKPNQVPFCSITAAVNTLIVDTQITYDESNILAFNLRGGTDTTTYALSGFIFGSTASWVDHTPASVSLVVSNNTGVVRLTFTNLPALVPIINVSGCVRHV